MNETSRELHFLHIPNWSAPFVLYIEQFILFNRREEAVFMSIEIYDIALVLTDELLMFCVSIMLEWKHFIVEKIKLKM